MRHRASHALVDARRGPLAFFRGHVDTETGLAEGKWLLSTDGGFGELSNLDSAACIVRHRDRVPLRQPFRGNPPPRPFHSRRLH